MEFEFEYLVEDGQILLEDKELERLCEETGLDEDEVLNLVSEGIGIDWQPGQAAGSTNLPKPDFKDSEEKFAKNGKKIGKIFTKAKGAVTSGAKKAGDAIVSGAKKAGGAIAKHPKISTGVGAAAVLGTVGAVAGAKALKKRKQRKQEEEAMHAEDVMIEYLIENEELSISVEDMEFLMEASDFELSEEEILTNILEEAKKDPEPVTGIGIDKYYDSVEKANTLGNRVVTKLKKGAKKAGGAVGKAAKVIKDHPKTSIAAGVAIGTGATIAGVRALKKRKQRKQEEEAMHAEDVMIEVLLGENGNISISREDMEFLVEASNFELSQEEILVRIAESEELSEAGFTEGIKKAAGKVGDFYSKDFKAAAGENKQKKFFKNVANSDSPMAADEKNKQALLDKAKEHGGKALKHGLKGAGKAVGTAAVIAGLTAGGIAGVRALKKRKAKKQEEQAMKAEDVMIQYVITENAIYLTEDDLDFLLEATDFELTEEHIIKAILEAEEVKLEIPGDGVKVVTSEKELAKIREKQAEDIEDGPDADDDNEGVRTNGGEIKVQESVEYDEFAETWEGDHIIMEAVLEDMGIELTESEMLDMIDQHLLSERSIVKLDKQAKLTHAQKKALMVIAREQNDPIYKKLDKLYKQRRVLLNQLEEKYGSRAMSRVRSAKSKAKKVKDED